MNQTKICTTCHIDKELTEFLIRKDTKKHRNRCKSCDSERNKHYWKDNKEKLAEQKKQYREENKEKLAEQKKQYFKDNKEKLTEQKKQHYEVNKERIAEQHKKYHEATRCQRLDNMKRYREANRDKVAESIRQWAGQNKDRLSEYNKQYRKENKDKIAELVRQYRQTPKGKAVKKAGGQNRRAQKRNNGGKHTAQDILNLFDQQSGTCPYCKTKLYKTGHNKYHVDHVVPLSKGGSNSVENLQLTCPQCNLSKSDKLPEIFAQQVGILL